MNKVYVIIEYEQPIAVFDDKDKAEEYADFCAAELVECPSNPSLPENYQLAWYCTYIFKKKEVVVLATNAFKADEQLKLDGRRNPYEVVADVFAKDVDQAKEKWQARVDEFLAGKCEAFISDSFGNTTSYKMIDGKITKVEG